jgi:hypothetical protein
MALSHPKATQEADTQQNQQPNNLAINEATSIEEEGEGWQLVRRRTKYIKKTTEHQTSTQSAGQNSKSRGFKNPTIEQAYARAFNVRLCLKCMGKDHRRAQCRELVRCFQCSGLGHTFKQCKQLPIKPKIKSHPLANNI